MRLRIPKRQAKLLGALALAAALCAVAPAAFASPRATRLAKHPGAKTLYWGAQINEQLTGEKAPWDMSAVSKFERLTGKGLSLIEFSSPWAICGATCVPQLFPTTPMENVRGYGAIPIFSWNSGSSPPSTNQPDFQLADVISGRYDAYVRGFAEEARAWGHPFFLRFNWEMNGFWYPWSEGVNGNKAGEYVTAWRHVHDIFTSVGATNATWVWCPNVDIYGELPGNLKKLYPGGRYVDWTCIDGFNWGKRRGSPGWLSFNQVFHSTYRRIVHGIAPHKPMLLAEVASSDRGGSKAAWIKDMLRKVRTRYGKVRGVSWYDVNDRGTNWPLETSRSATRAFRSGIRSRAFLPNVFGSLSTGPIRPPARR